MGPARPVAAAATALAVVFGAAACQPAPNTSGEARDLTSTAPPQRSSGTEPATPRSSPAAPLAFDGDGDRSTEPFTLTGGRYRVAWTTEGTCSWSFWLGDPATGRFPYELGSADGRADDYDGAGDNNVYGVEPGDYFLDTITGDDCPWTLTLAEAD